MTLPENPTAPRWPQSLPRQTRLQAHLHKPFKTQRTAIVAALANTPFPDDRKAAERLASCCNTAFVVHDPAAGEIRPWLPRCQSRLCPFCGRGRTAKVAARVLPLVEDIKVARHITLTFRSRKQHLGHQLNELRAAWKKFRKHPEVAARIRGGIYTIEITRDPESGLWHPHLHIIYDGDYFPQKLLSSLWQQHMKGGLITWISKVDNTQAAAWEISKYVNKPPHAVGWPPEAIASYAHAVAGTRMLQTFGTLHNRKLDSTEEPPPEKPDVKMANLAHIAHLATLETPIAQDLVTLLWCRWPMFRAYLFSIAPADCQAEELLVNPGMPVDRPPRGPPGKPLPQLDQDQRDRLDEALDMSLLYWEAAEAAGSLEPLPLEAEV